MDYEKLKTRLNALKEEEKKEKQLRRIVLLEGFHIKSVFPMKTKNISYIIQKIEDSVVRNLLQKDFKRYRSSVEKSDVTTLKSLSLKYKIDLMRIHGYKYPICDTEDLFMNEIFSKIDSLYGNS